MRSLRLPILASGAIITAHVGVSNLRRAALLRSGQPVPPAVELDLLIDTGATSTLVDAGTFRSLQFEKPTGFASVHSATTRGVSQACAVYDVHLLLGGLSTVNTVHFDPLPVLADEFLNQPFSGLLGRDVLNQLRLVWNGPASQLDITYA